MNTNPVTIPIGANIPSRLANLRSYFDLTTADKR